MILVSIEAPTIPSSKPCGFGRTEIAPATAAPARVLAAVPPSHRRLFHGLPQTRQVLLGIDLKDC